MWQTTQQIQAGEEAKRFSQPCLHTQTVHISKLDLLAQLTNNNHNTDVHQVTKIPVFIFAALFHYSSLFLTSSLSVLMSFCAAAAAAAGTGTVPGLLVTSTGALGRMSAGIRAGDMGPRYGLNAAAAAAAFTLVARLGVTENMGCGREKNQSSH